MKTITDQLFELGKGIIEQLPEIRDESTHFTMADDGGVECQVGEFLYGLVKVLQPENILETGTYSGISSMYLAQGLKDNNHGKLITLEFEDFHKQRAEKLWNQVGVGSFVNCQLISSLEYQTEQQFDLLFLDSEPNIRWAELEKFYPNLKEGGFIGIHDVPRNMTQGNINSDHPEISSWPFGNIPEKMIQWLKSGELVKFHLPTPRGLVFFYKPKAEDYRI